MAEQREHGPPPPAQQRPVQLVGHPSRPGIPQVAARPWGPAQPSTPPQNSVGIPATPAPRPPMTPSTSVRDFAPDRILRPLKPSPGRGWRRVIHALSFGAISPGPSAAERTEIELVAAARTPIRGCRRVAVLSRKGGIGKTTTTLMLGHTLARHRGDRVIGLDANPDAGSLAYRVRRETDATVTQLIQASEHIRRYSDMRAFTSQAPSRLEIIASDDDPTISVALGEPEYRQILHTLEQHYNLILMDTGTGILDSATQGILRMCDQIVVCAAPGIDASRASSFTLDWLDQHGFHDLVENAVVVINQVGKGGRVEIKRVAQHFSNRCRAVVQVPWDPVLADGAETSIDDLRPATREAYLQVAAAVARSFVFPPRRR